MRKYMLLFCLSVFWGGGKTNSYGTIISWGASSGVLPSDSSIPVENRFELAGESSFVSLSEGILNIHDDSDPLQVVFKKTGIDTIPADKDWAFETVIRMNSHNRVTLDWGADLGIIDGNKSVLLLIAEDAVGFAALNANSFVNGMSSAMDTTDSFHSYRVIKNSNLVNLYVDNQINPVLSIPYGDFSFWTQETNMVMLAGTSKFGTANYDIKSFAYNLQGAAIPEPTTLLLLALGTLALRKRKYYHF